ncbi:MAG: AmmeMemoRadiSam system protein B, partial [Steroidobacteraceae bacterium]
MAADAPHAREHSLEVQLPFLQTLLGEFRVLPIAAGDATAREV